MIWNVFIEFLQVQSRFNFSIFFSPVNILEMYLPSNFSDCSMATLSKRFFISFEIAFTSSYFSEKGKFWWKSIFNWHGIRFNFSFWQKFSKKAFFKKKYVIRFFGPVFLGFGHQVFWSISGTRIIFLFTISLILKGSLTIHHVTSFWIIVERIPHSKRIAKRDFKISSLNFLIRFLVHFHCFHPWCKILKKKRCSQRPNSFLTLVEVFCLSSSHWLSQQNKIHYGIIIAVV